MNLSSITKKLILIVLFFITISTFPLPSFATTEPVEITTDSFPDKTFRSYVSKAFDLDADGFLSENECKKATVISLHKSGIQSVKGIEYLTGLKKLYIADNELDTLDLHNNISLTELYCNKNKISSINISGLSALTTINCSENSLTEINVSGCTALKYFYAHNNNITEADFSECSGLIVLDLSDNHLQTINLGTISQITDLWLSSNNLSELDPSNLSNLSLLNIQGNKIRSLDIRNCTQLSTFLCSNNQLSSIDVSHCYGSFSLGKQIIPIESQENELDLSSFLTPSDLENISFKSGSFDPETNILSLDENITGKVSYTYSAKDKDSNISKMEVIFVYDTSDILFGDVNSDNEVNGKDVTHLMRFLADWEVEIDPKASDVNSDGVINGKDITILMKFLADWDIQLDGTAEDTPVTNWVFLSPSNQYGNTWASKDTNEKNEATKFADSLQSVLESRGVGVLRSDETTPSDRAIYAVGCKLYMPLHTNAANGYARGCRLYVYKNYGKYQTQINNSLSALKFLFNRVSELNMSPGPKGYYDHDKWLELGSTSQLAIPCVYSESIFHDNLSDIQWYRQNYDRFVTAYADGICDYLSSLN